MAYKMAELIKARDIVAEKMRIPNEAAVQVIGYYNGGFGAPAPDTDKIGAILAGDVSAVPAACKALGITTGDGSGDDKPAGGASDGVKPGDGVKDIKAREAAPATSKSKKAVKNKDKGPAEGVHVRRVQDMTKAELLGEDENELPAGFVDDLRDWLENWAICENIDLTRLHAQQWRAACMFIGEKIKQSKVLHDTKWIHAHGGRGYSGARLEALLNVWAYLCGKYKQVPLVSDFVYFSGVSKGFFYDYEGRGLSSTSVDILKKARDIEEAGLGSSVAGGGAGAVGGMFLLKARHNYSETVTIQHTSNTTALGVAELPLLEVKKP